MISREKWFATVAFFMVATVGAAQATLQDSPPAAGATIRRQEVLVGGDRPLPEALRRKFNLPPGATFKDLPAGATRTSPKAKRYFRALASLAAEARADVPAAVGAVIAWERLGLTPEAWQLDAPIKLGKPLRGKVAQGTVLVREVREADGEELFCIARISGQAFEPFVGERGAIYPSPCLFDGDKDGVPDSIKAEPYRPDSPAIVQPLGEPVVWTPLSAQSSNPHAVELTLTRELRVTSIDGQQVTLASQLKVLLAGLAEPIISKVPHWQPVTLPLREGARVTIDGVDVAIAKVDGAWHLRSSGPFLPWVELRPDRTGYHVLPGGVPAAAR